MFRVQDNDVAVICRTQNNAATNSSLNLFITGNAVKPTIVSESINSSFGTKAYNCSGGEIIIDANLWRKGILKASFNFDFENREKPFYWKGKVY